VSIIPLLDTIYFIIWIYYFQLRFLFFIIFYYYSICSCYFFGIRFPYSFLAAHHHHHHHQQQQNGKRHRGLQKHKHKQLTFSPPIDWFFPPAAIHFVLLIPRCSLTPFILLFLLSLFSGSYNSNTIQPGWTIQTAGIAPFN